ncbi:hypothetical protein BDZ97DRAFT_1920407 [Flammula alnicola]|nr:hypothetical protein BDZ97DRAFT_1920407 [Flammula alnicola]
MPEDSFNSLQRDLLDEHPTKMNVPACPKDITQEYSNPSDFSADVSKRPPPPRKKTAGLLVTLPSDDDPPRVGGELNESFLKTHSRQNTFGDVFPTPSTQAEVSKASDIDDAGGQTRE